ncbi:MAG: hypothetical protein KIT25_03730 [Enhydrobacter sp.]|nr:MAG: hypothetical protein KIT25_03730 [Enhydrobacter sp.]
MSQEQPYVAPFIRRRMPDASEEDILAASENLRAYLKLLYGIFLHQEVEKRHGDSETREPDARFGADGTPPSSL